MNQAIKNYQDIKNLIKGTIAENAPIIPLSAQQEINIDKLIEALANLDIPKRDFESQAVFLVARSFDINRPGTIAEKLHGGVLGGILKRGKLKVGEEIEIKPGLSVKKTNQQTYQTLVTKILSLYKGNQSVEEVVPGASISIETSLDPFLTKADSLSGCIAGIKGQLPEISYKIKVKTKLFTEVLGVQERKEVAPLKTKEMLMLRAIPQTEAVLVEELFAFAIVKSCIELLVIVFEALVVEIPFTNPNAPLLVFVVAFVKLAILL